MIWVKLRIGEQRAWIELNYPTPDAFHQVKGIELLASIIPYPVVRVEDTRYSKHPSELTLPLEAFRQIFAEQIERNPEK